MKLASDHKKTSRTLWLKRLTIGSLLFVALIIALPYAIQFGLIKGLNNAASKTVIIDDVDFNPFTGKLAISHLRTQEPQQADLSISSVNLQIDWLPLFNKRLLINSLTIQDAHIKIQQKDSQTLYIGSIKIPLNGASRDTNEEASTSWELGLNKLNIINNSFTFQSDAFSDDFTISQLTINEAFSWDPNNLSTLSFNTQLNTSPINGHIRASLFSEQPSVKGQLNVKNLNLNAFKALAGENIEELKGLLDTDIKFSLLLGKNSIDYSQTGSLSIKQAVITSASVQHTLGSGDWSGSVQVITSPEKPSINAEGQLTLSELSSTNQLTQLVLANTQTLTVKQLSIKKLNNIAISSVEVGDLSIGKTASNNSLLESKKLIIDKLQLHDLNNIDIKKINIDGLNAVLDINKQGDIPLLNTLTKSLPAADEKKTSETNNAAKPFQFQVANIDISKNSQIKFSKETELERVEKKITIDQLNIGNINSLTPNSPTPINIQATIDQFSKLSIKGQVAPLSEKINTSIQTQLSAFELHDFSPIFKNELGYTIENGQLNADLDIDIKDNILDGKTSLEINQLALEPANESTAKKITQQLSMPLESALSMLRDDNNNIKLNIPVKGDLASPDFNISDVINTALGNALQGTVKNVLKYALQPYGVMFMAAEKAYGIATSIKLEPLIFPPGDSVLAENSINQINKIGELMQKRPQLSIHICGFATQHDHMFLQNLANSDSADTSTSTAPNEKPLQEPLLKLASERQVAVKTHLVNNYHLKATRLFTCKPRVEKDLNNETTAKPRVELLI